MQPDHAHDESKPFVVAGIVIVALSFAYGVLSRMSLPVRVGAVATLLVAFFIVAVVMGQVQAASMTNRCIDF